MARTEAAPEVSPGPYDEEHSAHRVSPLSRAWDALLQPSVAQPLAVFVLSRFLFLILTYFGVVLFNSVLHGPHPSFLHQLLPAWSNRWDSAWYVQIAERGYGWKKAVGTSPTAFFPLYPLLIHVVQSITRRSTDSVALLISNLAFFAALLYLWRLTAWELGKDAAGRAILYIAVFPTALFFFAGYSESLFLLLTVACLYHGRREQWVLAGIFGGLAAATRVTGVLLIVPLLWQYGWSCNFSLRRVRPSILALLLVPAGLAAFMAYLAWAVGDPLAFSHYQAAWQKLFTPFLWAGFLESLRQILLIQPPASFYQAHNLINAGIGLAFLVLTILATRRLSPAYGLYLTAFWIVTLSSPAMANGYPVPLISLSRYVLTLFPVFMYLAVLGRNRAFNDGYLVLSTGMLALLTVQFINGGWVI